MTRVGEILEILARSTTPKATTRGERADVKFEPFPGLIH